MSCEYSYYDSTTLLTAIIVHTAGQSRDVLLRRSQRQSDRQLSLSLLISVACFRRGSWPGSTRSAVILVGPGGSWWVLVVSATILAPESLASLPWSLASRYPLFVIPFFRSVDVAITTVISGCVSAVMCRLTVCRAVPCR